jgi:cysteine desulfurase
MQRIVYLDNAATTPVDPAVFEEMKPFFTERFANPMTYMHSSAGDVARTAVGDREGPVEVIHRSSSIICASTADIMSATVVDADIM